MKKALILVLTLALLLNTVAFAAMVIPSKTSPDPLSGVNLSDEMFYQELNSMYSDEAYIRLQDGTPKDGSAGATVSATIYKNYLVVPIVYDDVMDNEHQKIDIYDLSSNDAFWIDTWTMEDLGWEYKKQNDGVTPDNNFQDSINAMYIDGGYVYLVKLNTNTWKQELFIYTNPLDSEEYLSDPESVRPTLVSGPTEISSEYTSETYLRGRLAQMTKIGNYIIFAMAKTSATGRTISYVDVSDPKNPVSAYYNTASVLSYTNASGETVSNSGKIMNLEFKGTVGYFVVSDEKDGSSKWDLVKVDFKNPKNPQTKGGAELALPEKTSEYMEWGATIYAANEYIYVSTRSESDWALPSDQPLIYVVKDEDMSYVSSFNVPFRDGIGDMYDMGDMLILTSGSLRSDGAVAAIRLNSEKTEMSEFQYLGIPGSNIANLQAHCFNILAYGTKLYLAFGEGNMKFNAADPYRAVIGVLNFEYFEPYTFTVDSVPAVANDSYTVTGSIYTSPLAGDVGIHLYINGSKTPVEAEIVSNELGFSINSWSYTFNEAGTYNVVAKLFDTYGDYDNMTEEFKLNIKSTTGINAQTEYSTPGDLTALSVSDISGAVDYTGKYMGGQWRATVSAAGLSAYDKYLMVPMVNTTQKADAEDGSRNVLYFYDTTVKNPLSTPVKSYNHSDMNLNRNNTWNVENYPRMIGATIDDNYLYVLSTETQHYQYNAVNLHIYKNPINKETGAFSDTLEEISSTEVLNSFETIKLNDSEDTTRYSEMKKISKDGKNYLVISYPFTTASTVADNGISRITIADITDAANVTKTDVNMSTITYGGLNMTYFYDMKFDGNYGYIVGANDGSLDAENETLTGAYMALFKVDFSNPTSPSVVGSWKLCDINYEWLFRNAYSDSVRTRVVPSININDHKVMIGLYHREGFTNTDKQNTGLGSMKAYVLSDNTLKTYEAGEVYAPVLKGSTAMKYGTRQLYFVNGAYMAMRYLSENGWGSNYYVGTESEIADRATNAGAANTLSSSTTYGEPICSIVIGNKLYTNYFGENEGRLVCFDFEDIKPDVKAFSITSSGKYFAKVIAENKGQAVTGVPVAALYKGDLLVDAAVGTATTFTAGETVECEKLLLKVPTDTDYSAYTIKTFIFGSMSNIKPLVESMSMSEQD